MARSCPRCAHLALQYLLSPIFAPPKRTVAPHAPHCAMASLRYGDAGTVYDRGMPNQAAIIAAGSEMLGPSRLDTNSLKITAALEDFGIGVVRKSVVGDRLSDMVDEIRFALSRADLLFITGGLGPTEDDLTREALCDA